MTKWLLHNQKIISRLLCVLFFLNLCPHLLVEVGLEYLHRQARWEKIVLLPNNLLTRIEKDSAIFIEDEFWHEGRFYDVVRHESQADRIVYYCAADDDEAMIQQLMEESSGDTKNTIPLTKFLKIKAEYLNNQSLVLQKGISAIGKSFSLLLPFSAVQDYFPVQSPPPRC